MWERLESWLDKTSIWPTTNASSFKICTFSSNIFKKYSLIIFTLLLATVKPTRLTKIKFDIIILIINKINTLFSDYSPGYSTWLGKINISIKRIYQSILINTIISLVFFLNLCNIIINYRTVREIEIFVITITDSSCFDVW